MKFGVGQWVKRTEDIRFVTGQGQYTDDLHFPNETFACFHRTPQSHARITSIDISAAKAAPGVIDVLTHVDVEAFGANPMPALAGAAAWVAAGAVPQALNITERASIRVKNHANFFIVFSLK